PALHAFSGCPQLLDYVRRPALGLVTPYGIDGLVSVPGGLPVPEYAAASPVLAPAATPKTAPDPVEGVDYSGTNVQEPGVAEPDVITSDGRTVFSVIDGRLRGVALRGSETRALGSLALPDGHDHELLRFGSRLVVITRSF